MLNQEKPISIILILFSLVLILVDWRLMTYVTFSDLFIVMIFVLLFIKNYVKFERMQFISFYVVLAYLMINLIVQLGLNPNFDYISGVIGTIKIMLYFSTIIFLYNYVTHNQLQIKLMTYLNRGAMFVCAIGIYIYVSLSLNLYLPFRFMWIFTRNDSQSYLLGAFTNVIRMRSIFGEPAHMGFFLLLILGVSYFNDFNYRLSKSKEVIIMLSILLSFSFSTIAVLAIIKVLDLVKSRSLFYFDRSKYLLLVGMFIGVILLFTNSTFNIAIVSRVSRIFSGVDTSASVRLLGSWSYISPENFILGNGLGNTPLLFNNFAYVITELGIIGFLIFLYFNLKLSIKSAYFFVLFVLLNFMKGGYLGAGYWAFLLVIIVFAFNTNNQENTLLGESK